MIEKILHQGYCFDQFKRSLARYMPMFRKEGYPELADFLTADFVILKREFRELEELKAGGVSSFVSSQLKHKLKQWHDLRSSISSEFQSQESSITQMITSLMRKDTNRAELLSSLDSSHEEIARLERALKYAKESSAIIADELAGLDISRGQTLKKLGSAPERLIKLRGEATKILSSSKDSVRANLQAELK